MIRILQQQAANEAISASLGDTRGATPMASLAACCYKMRIMYPLETPRHNEVVHSAGQVEHGVDEAHQPVKPDKPHVRALAEEGTEPGRQHQDHSARTEGVPARIEPCGKI